MEITNFIENFLIKLYLVMNICLFTSVRQTLVCKDIYIIEVYSRRYYFSTGLHRSRGVSCI